MKKRKPKKTVEIPPETRKSIRLQGGSKTEKARTIIRKKLSGKKLLEACAEAGISESTYWR